jgi:hypothetical protein
MKMFPGLRHPDDVDALPAEFVGWAFEFERVENEAKAEAQKAAQKR